MEPGRERKRGNLQSKYNQDVNIFDSIVQFHNWLLPFVMKWKEEQTKTIFSEETKDHNAEDVDTETLMLKRSVQIPLWRKKSQRMSLQTFQQKSIKYFKD